MSEISKLNNYNIKDKTARANHDVLVREINGFVDEMNAALKELENKISNGGYTLPIATSGALGGIKTGYNTAGKNYKVQVDSSGNAFVNVPWTDTNTDTNTTYTFAGGTNSFTVTPSGGTTQTVTVTPSIAAASTSAAGLMSSADKTKLDGIATGANAYSLPLSANGTRGGIQIGYTASGANIPVQLSSEKAYVALTSTAVTTALGYTPPTTNTTYSAGSGLTLNGTTFNVGAGTGITVAADTISVTDYSTIKSNAANGQTAYGWGNHASKGYATTSYVDTKVAALVNSAPETLNTLGELATALQEHESEYGALLETVGGKYVKPSGGIPKSDLASAVQTSLNNADTALQKSGGSLNADASLTFSTWGTRFLTITGNAISADMSNETGGWAGNFASVKDPSGTTTAMLGWYGSTSLTHIYMGGTYDDPFMKFTPAGQFTFKYTPKVGSTAVALTSDLPTKTSQLTNDSNFLTSETYKGTVTSVKVGSTSYSQSGGVVSLPAYPTIPTSLKNPNALTFGSKTYDGSSAVTLTASDIGALTSHQSLTAYAKLESPAFTGTPTAPTAATSTNNTQIATTAFVKAQGYTSNTGTVTSVKVGSTSYSPSSGVVSLPAYPTTLPASDVYSWAKASTKPTYSWSEITNKPTIPDISGKLDKTTYEASKELACGSNGKVCLGKFGAYDTNITIELNSTTNETYHATIVIHSQNVVANGTGGTVGCYVYGDADNHVTPLISVFRPYGSASRQIEVYASLAGWSKNLVHVQAVALSDGGMTDVLTSVSEIPTAITGKTKVTPVNVLTTAFLGKTAKAASASVADSANAVAWANVSSKPSFATVATSGSYADLTNKPTIPTYTLGSFGITATATELNYVDGVTSNIQTQLNGKLSTDGGTISGDLTLYAASGDSPKLRLQRGDNTGTITDWNINVVSGALNFNTVSVSGSTEEKTVASIGYNGQFNVNGSFMENSVALSDKYQAKGSYASPSDVSTALSTAKSYTDTAVANLVDSSPEALNTLNELAAALGDDPNFATTIATQIGGKLSTSGGTITGTGLKVTGSTNGYSVDATGYVKGSWLQTTSGNLSSSSDKICVLDSSGWVYYRTKEQLKSDLEVPTAYTLPTASSTTLGGVKVGSNITVNSGTISLSKDNVTTALGYTPPTTNTTYSVATASTAGLVKPVSVITKPTLNSVTTTAGKYYQVQMSSDGNMFVNVPWEAGSTSSNASTVSVTDTTPTSATTYYSLYSTGKSGNQTVRANKDLYFYDGGSYGYFNVGSSDSIGGLTLHYNNGKYVNLATATTLTANRNIYLPDADGTIITTGNFPTASSTTLGGVKSGGDVTINSGVITVNKAAKVKSIDTTSTMATCRVALLLDAAGRDNDELIKTADLKYNVSKKSLIENGVALSDKYGTYTHNIELETQNGSLWITVVDNHATAYNDTTFREKYPNGFFQATGATWSWDGILVGQLGVSYGEFYGVVSYTDGYTAPVMDSMTFTVISDTVSN